MPALPTAEFGAQGGPTDRPSYPQNLEVLEKSSHGTQGFPTPYDLMASNGAPGVGVTWDETQKTSEVSAAYGCRGLNEPISPIHVQGAPEFHGQKINDAVRRQGFSGPSTIPYTPQGVSNMPGSSSFQGRNDVATSYYGPRFNNAYNGPQGSNTQSVPTHTSQNDMNDDIGRYGLTKHHGLQKPNGLVDLQHTTMSGQNNINQLQYGHYQGTSSAASEMPSRPDIARATYGQPQFGPVHTSDAYAPQSLASNITYPQSQPTGQPQVLERQSMDICVQQPVSSGYGLQSSVTGVPGMSNGQVAENGVNNRRMVCFGGAFSHDSTDMYDGRDQIGARTNGMDQHHMNSNKMMPNERQQVGPKEIECTFQPRRIPTDETMDPRNGRYYDPQQVVNANRTDASSDRNANEGLETNKPNNMYDQLRNTNIHYGPQPIMPECRCETQSKGTDGNAGFAKIGPVGMTESFSQTDTYGSGATSGTFDTLPRAKSQSYAPYGIRSKDGLKKVRDEYRQIDASDPSDMQGAERSDDHMVGETRQDSMLKSFGIDNAGQVRKSKAINENRTKEKRKNAVKLKNLQKDDNLKDDGDEAANEKVDGQASNSEIGQNSDDENKSLAPQSESQKFVQKKTPEQPRRGRTKVATLPNRTASSETGLSQAMRISSPEATRPPARSPISSPTRPSSIERTNQCGKETTSKSNGRRTQSRPPVSAPDKTQTKKSTSEKPRQSGKKIRSRTPSPPRRISNQSLSSDQTKATKRKTTVKRKKEQVEKTKDLIFKDDDNFNTTTSASEEKVLELRGKSVLSNCRGIEQEVTNRPGKPPSKDLGTSMSDQSFRETTPRNKRGTDLGGMMTSRDSSSNYQYLREYSSGEEGDHGTSTESFDGRIQIEKREPWKVICTKHSGTNDPIEDPKPCWSRPLCRPISRPCKEDLGICAKPPCWSRPPCMPPQKSREKIENRPPWQNVNSGRNSRRPQTSIAIQPPPPCQRNPPWPAIEPYPSRKTSPTQCACVSPSSLCQSPQRVPSKPSSHLKAECRCSWQKESKHLADNLDCKEGKAEGYPCSETRQGLVEYPRSKARNEYDCRYGFLNSEVNPRMFKSEH